MSPRADDRVEHLRQIVQRQEADVVDAKVTEQRRRRARQRAELELQRSRIELRQLLGQRDPS